MIRKISVGITKLVLLWKIIFSAHNLLDDLNGKMFHTFVHANLLLYDLVLVKSDYVVRGTHSNCIFHVLILHMLWLFFYFADIIKVKGILIGITKLVLSRKIIFSNPDLCNDLNGKLFHTFVSTNLLLYDLLLVKSDCVVTVSTQLRIPCVHIYSCCDLVRIHSVTYSMCWFYTCCDFSFLYYAFIRVSNVSRVS